MNAKAKVVAEVVDAFDTGLLIPYWIGDVENPFPAGTQLVTLTDHEAALAAALHEAQRWEASSEQWKFQACERAQQLATLLTGLEALAGEWERKYSDAGVGVLIEQLRTLASAGLEHSITNEEENK